MKKILLMVLATVAAMSASAVMHYLYWQVDVGENTYVDAFSYATVREDGSEVRLPFYDTSGEDVGTDMVVNDYSALKTSGTAAGPLYTGVDGDGLEEMSFHFELWQEGAKGDSLVGWRTYCYGDVAPYIYTTMSAGAGHVPLAVNPVPEPSGALLLAVGLAGLFLRRRKRLVAGVAAAVSLGAFASAKNLVYDFRPSAGDCYADGSPVLDYESYALVWLPTGSDGVEITADCRVVDETKGRILRVRKSFRRGELFTFQVDSSVSEPCVKAGGSWAVYLLDTRVYGPDGMVTLAETADGVTAAVNASVKIGRSVVPVTEGTSGPAETKLGEAGCVAQATVLPADMPQPRITGMTVVDGEVRLTVSDTVPCVQYNLAAGESPSELIGKAAKSPKNGVAGEEIELVAPAGRNAMFFKVKRN